MRSWQMICFCLSANAQISLNFALRGYLPLVGTPIQLVDVGPTSQSQLLSKADEVIATLVHAAEIDYFDDSKFVNDDAGHKAISLPQSEYVLNFILPNLYFHISMVYAIARAHGVSVSKGDFDGIHYYPEYFSFV